MIFFINHGIHGNHGKRIKTKNKLLYKRSFSVFLPTETEWVYACRAGSTTRFCFGGNDSSRGNYARYGPNSGSKTHPVAQKQPNAWGLYDMHGNAFRRKGRLPDIVSRISYYNWYWWMHVASTFPLAHHYRAVLKWWHCGACIEKWLAKIW